MNGSTATATHNGDSAKLVAPAPTTLDQRMEDLEQGLDHLNATLGKLEVKLIPVCNTDPTVPRPVDGSDAPKPVRSPLAHRIADASARLRCLNYEFERLAGLVELP
jgi:hypothetical protein